jgi:hypothetical protein
MLRETRYGECVMASRLCSELIKRGGICAAFAAFLRWRADMLPRGWVRAFEQAREAAPVSRSEADAFLRQELGARGEELGAQLDKEPCWSTRARWAFRSRFEGRPVVMEAAREPVSAAEFRDFEREVSRLAGAPPSAVSSSALKQFRQWLSLTDDLARERAYLEAAGEFRTHTSFLFPEIVPSLCSGRVLSFTWIDGTPVSSRIASGGAKLGGQLAELVLELAGVLGMIDGDLDLEDVAIADGGRLAVRRWNRFIAVPPGLRLAVLKYLCGAMAGESPRAARMLVRLALGFDSESALASLRRALASVEPELKGELRFPASATMFESHWRALRSINRNPPLYLDCLQRNLHAVGHWCSEAAPQSIDGDPLAEAQFAVLGRVIRRRGEDLFQKDSASGWAWGAAMLPWKALRRMIRLAEAFGESEAPTGFNPAQAEADTTAQNRRVLSFIGAALLLAVFLAGAHVARAESEPAWRSVGLVAAAAAFAGLAGVVVRLD